MYYHYLISVLSMFKSESLLTQVIWKFGDVTKQTGLVMEREVDEVGVRLVLEEVLEMGGKRVFQEGRTDGS